MPRSRNRQPRLVFSYPNTLSGTAVVPDSADSLRSSGFGNDVCEFHINFVEFLCSLCGNAVFPRLGTSHIPGFTVCPCELHFDTVYNVVWHKNLSPADQETPDLSGLFIYGIFQSLAKRADVVFFDVYLSFILVPYSRCAIALLLGHMWEGARKYWLFSAFRVVASWISAFRICSASPM